jgi:hypothetical protein
MIPTWAERCEQFGDEIVTNAKIQQVMQEEIDELRERLEETRQLYIKELALQKLSDISQEIEQEPVAWIDLYDLERLPHYDCHIGSQKQKHSVPLYTQPMRELSDEKILQTWVNKNKLEGAQGILNFARIILAKACNSTIQVNTCKVVTKPTKD